MSLVLALILAIPVLTIPAPLSFADSGSDAAALLHQYGFIEGDSGDLMVDGPLTRGQACVLLAEMYGKKSDAQNFVVSAGFKDVNEGDWFAPYVSYAKANKWISGFPDDTFKPNDVVTKQQWSAMLMNALKYEYTWNTVVADMNTLGIDFKATNDLGLKRGEAFDGMWQALLMPVNGQTQSLGLALGKIPVSVINDQNPNPSEPYIIESYANGLKEINFHFSKQLDKKFVLDPAGFKLIQDGNNYLAAVKVSYEDDDNIIRVVTSVPVLEDKVLNVTFPDLVFKDGTVLDSKEFRGFTYIDSDTPQVESAKIIGSNYILVTFSEPVMNDEVLNPNSDQDNIPELNPEDVTVNSGSTGIFKVTLFDNSSKAIIQTYSKLTKDTPVYLKSTIKDFAGNSLLSKVVMAKYSEDKEKPYVTGVRDVSPTQMTLVFNEPVRIMNSSSSNFYHTNSYGLMDTRLEEEDISGNEVTLHFKNNPIVPGNRMVYVEPGSLMDYSGNSCAFEQYAFNLSNVGIAPTILKPVTLVAEDEIKVAFNQPIQNTDGTLNRISNYRLWDTAGNDLSTLLSTAYYNTGDNSLSIHFTEKLKGLYRLSINGVKDYYGNTLTDNVVEFEMRDVSPPNPEKWTAKVIPKSSYSQDLIVHFDEPVAMDGKYSAMDYANYIVNGRSLDKYTVNEVKFTKVDDRTIKINIATAMNGGFDVKVDVDTYAGENDLIVGRVADLNGNYTPSFENKVDLEGKGNIKVEKFEYTGGSTFKIYLSDALTSIDLTDFLISDDRKQFTISSYDVEITDEGDYVLVVKVADDVNDIEETKLEAHGQNSHNAFGETLSTKSAVISASEFVPAYITKVRINGNTVDDVTFDKRLGAITMVMSKNINADSLSLFTFKVAGAEVRKATAGTKAVIIYIDSKDIADIRVGTMITQSVPMMDEDGIEVKGIRTQIQDID